MYTDARSSVGARNSVPLDTGESTTRSTLKPRNILMNGVAETSKKSKLSFLPLLLLNDSVRLGERRRIDSLSAIRRKCWMDTIINGEEKFAKIFFEKGVNARNEKSALSLFPFSFWRRANSSFSREPGFAEAGDWKRGKEVFVFFVVRNDYVPRVSSIIKQKSCVRRLVGTAISRNITFARGKSFLGRRNG